MRSIEEIKEEQNRIHEQVEALHTQLGILANELGIVRGQTLKERRLLKDIQWKFHWYWVNEEEKTIALIAVPTPLRMNQVTKVMGFHYHDGAEIEEGIHLRVDDEQLTLIFKKDQLRRVITDWKLEISWQPLKDRKAKVQEELEHTDALLGSLLNLLE